MDETKAANLEPYYFADRSDILAFVPDGVGRVLDIGCAGGRFGSEVKSRGAQVWGIEMVPEAAYEAATRLDRVLQGTFRDVEDQLQGELFDLITFTDVLEHMTDCEEVLRDVRKYLAPGGRVLASLPNIRHWPELLTIFWRGDFPYQDSGIFDRTHVKFFTQKSMLRMFDQCGYNVETCEGINGFVGGKLPLANFLTRGRFKDCAFLQFAILARPRS